MKVRFYNLSVFNYDCTELCRQVSALRICITDELCYIFIMLINVAFPQALYYQLCVGWKVQREGTRPRVWPILSYAQHPAFHVSTFCFFLRAALHISWHNDQAPSHELNMRSLESARIIFLSKSKLSYDIFPYSYWIHLHSISERIRTLLQHFCLLKWLSFSNFLCLFFSQLVIEQTSPRIRMTQVLQQRKEKRIRRLRHQRWDHSFV